MNLVDLGSLEFHREPTEATAQEGSQPGREPTDNEHPGGVLTGCLMAGGAFMLPIICNFSMLTL